VTPDVRLQARAASRRSVAHANELRCLDRRQTANTTHSPAHHSIILSTRKRIDGGMLMPSA
jgi:hypothetical protein